jgi:DNA topoisomerase IB
MKSKIASDIGSNNTKVSETASVARLIMSTGIRPGSDRDTGAEKQAYGATTLRVEHVVVNDSKEPGAPKVILTFTGKKGVDLKIPVHDEEIAKDLIRRAKSSKDGRLFGTTDGELRDYVSKASGGKFKPKDFRTLRGTELAADVVREHKCCDSEKERKAAIKHVAKIVSTALGNTPAIALQSYIDPIVFAKWSCENCGASSSTMSVHFNSMDPYNTGADVYWHGDGGGDVESEDDDVDVYDEELEETPSHIVSILGFDPKTEFSKQPRQPKVTNVQK